MGLGLSFRKSKSKSGPIAPWQVANYYNTGVSTVGAEPTGGTPDWSPERLTGGDYGRLEDSLAATPVNRLNQQRDVDRNRFMAEMRKRGIADDPAAFKLMEETIDQPYANALSDIYSGAATSRYGLQLDELSNVNPLTFQQAWQSYQAPRDFWLNKMKTYYGGMGNYSEQGSKAMAGGYSTIRGN